MTRLTISIVLITMIAIGCNKARAAGPKAARVRPKPNT